MQIIKTKSFQLAVNSKGNPNSKKLAVILPGRLDTKDYACFSSHLEHLAKKGFFAVSFDPPGTWESPGGIKLFTTTNYIKAVNEIIEYYGNKPALLLGHSRGGAVATLAGTSNKNVFGLILINPSLGAPSPPNPKFIKAGVFVDYRDLPPGTRKTIQQKKFELPLSYFRDGARYNDADFLKTCTKPKLMFYSSDDEFNTPKEVKRVFNTIPEPKVLHELNCNHDYRYYPKIVDEVNKEIGLFLNKYLSD